MKFSLVALNGRYTHSCMALYYLRNELEKNVPGCETAIHQLTINDPYYDTLLRLTGDGATALFFSVYIWNAHYVERLLHDVRCVLPDMPLVVGGPQAPWLGDLPAGCSVVHGPVEGLSAAFYNDLQELNLAREYTADPGKSFVFPYRAQDFADSLRNRQVYYESSRGCPFGCSYCLSSIDKGVQTREQESVRADVAEMVEHGVKTVRFVDRTFNASPARSLALWRYLAKLPGDTLFHFEIAPDRFTEEMFKFLATVPPGRFQFEMGIQSTNPATLAAVNRPMDLQTAAANTKRLMELDAIHLHVDLILGLPWETEASFHKSFNDVFALFPHYIQMGLLKVLPGTPIAGQIEEFGLLHCRQPPYQILANRWLDHASVTRLHLFGECVEAFYNNRFFRATLGYIHGRHEDAFEFFHALKEVCVRHDFFRLAKTQELMTRMLVAQAASRSDGDLLRDLLRYDWLCSGHRFLPDCLANQDLRAIKDEMWHTLPDVLPPWYENKTTRNEFFKRAVFARFSARTAAVLGLTGEDSAGAVCFLPFQTGGVFNRQQTILL